MVVGDFNGDGKHDLATANPLSNDVSVLLGEGDGTFVGAGNFPVGLRPFSVAVGDFDGDGKHDLATANDLSGNFSVLLGEGDGTFAGAGNFPVGASPRSVAVGDFDGDGKQDLAVANASSDAVSVVLGKGDGTFAGDSFPVGAGPISVAVGDFDGDGKHDLATANLFSNDVSVLLGEGDGTFAGAGNFPVGAGPISVAVGDFDGDGKHDLATANQFSSNVGVLLNTTGPIAIALSSASVAENQPSGTPVGTFSTSPGTVGFTYTLASGDGDADNASFTIVGDQLQTAASFDHEARTSYSIRVRSTDAAGQFTEQAFTVSVTDVNEAPTVAAPAAQAAYEDVDQALTGLSVGDPDGDGLTVTLSVSHGTLTLGTTAGLVAFGNGSGVVSLIGSQADLNAALASLVYRGSLNYSGTDTMSITAGDGGLGTNRSVALTVASAGQQADALQAQVTALRDAGVLTRKQANQLSGDLNLRGNSRDIGKVQQFLAEVARLLNAGVLSQAQADLLLGPGNVLLLSVTRR
jgi:hypothetical protein